MKRLTVLLVALWVVTLYALGVWRVIPLMGDSMAPALQQGDLILTTNLFKPQVGDVVAFHDKTGKLIVHRVVAVHPDQVITQGDNNRSPDPAQGFADMQVMVLHLDWPGRWLK